MHVFVFCTRICMTNRPKKEIIKLAICWGQMWKGNAVHKHFTWRQFIIESAPPSELLLWGFSWVILITAHSTIVRSYCFNSNSIGFLINNTTLIKLHIVSYNIQCRSDSNQGTFMISRPNLQYSDSMELRIWNGMRSKTNHLSVCKWMQGVGSGADPGFGQKVGEEGVASEAKSY